MKYEDLGYVGSGFKNEGRYEINFEYDDVMEIVIDIDTDGIYISNDGSSGCSYCPKTREELKQLVCQYIDNAEELDELFKDGDGK